MVDLYFKIKLIYGAIITGLFILILLSILIKCLSDSIREIRIETYLISIGYKRELISTASVGTNHTYGYVRVEDNGTHDVIRDYELKGMSFKQIKQKYT